jgi:PAS domain S-box-containing protein
MRIKVKILWTVLGMAALVTFMGGFAFNRLETIGSLAEKGATRESADYDDIMHIARTARRQLIVAAAAGDLLAVLLALFTGASIATALRQLTQAAVGFAAGEAGPPMPPYRPDEIGDFSVAFSVMMQRRVEAEENLKRANEEVEKRFNERTAELALERQRFADILNNLPAVVFEHWSLEDSRRNFVSNYVQALHGYTPEEWLSTPDFWTHTIHPDDRARVLETASRAFAIGEMEGERDQFRWITKDNRVVWGETYRRVIRKPADGTVGVRGFTLDITEQKEAEEELRKLHEQLVEASRLAGMAEVATNVLHNVGNVLNSVNVSATVVADRVRQSSAPHLARVAALVRENAPNLAVYLTVDPIGKKLPAFIAQLAAQLEIEQGEILKEIEGLEKNVEHIKDIVSVQQSYASAAGVSQKVDVVDMIEDSLRMNAGALTRHDVQLLREFEVRPVISVDKHKVMQILVNLIRNAKYACDEGGEATKQLTVRVTADDRVVRIAVIDNGAGIAPENMTRIFSHGFTTREGGHGFGLHSGALGARELGGSLRAQSDGPGRGATFTLELPLEPLPQ